jgi:hypothetical protein
MHTTLSAHPFAIDLRPGTYTVTVERGKEYQPQSQRVTLERFDLAVTFRLQRWIDASARGWYSGETHVHRTLEDLPNAMLAEDMNVALPLLYWVTVSATPPKQGRGTTAGAIEPRLIAVDPTHVIWPLNTEYEIFSVGKKTHTLGALFVLNHKTVFEEGVPPVREVGRRARREGALLELDKHNWPWSMMLVPVLDVDLYELANNHHWRTEFGYRQFGEAPAEYMKIESDERGWTERGWTDFGFQNYYALLNCGFRLRPTAGSASGVHPVPLGFGRVYVKLDGGFGYEAWMRGLNEGRSFVTTGPMLFVEVRGGRVSGTAESAVPLERIEIVVNGRVVRSVKPANRETARKGYESPIDEEVALDGSSWVAVRCFEDRPDRRVRFAHSAPVHVDVPGKPLRPRPEEVEYLVKRVEAELARNAGVLPEEALEEYREALRIYRGKLK